MKVLSPCKFSETYIREYNYKDDSFEFKKHNISFKKVGKVKIKECVEINGVKVPSLFGVRVFINGEEKVVLAGDLVKLAKEGKEVKTLKGERVVASEIGDCEICVFDFDTAYPPHSIFALSNGVLFRLLDPETIASIDIASKFASFITEALPGILELEFDKAILIHTQVTKKRYAGWKIEDKLLVKGLEYVRRDWGEKAKELQKKAIMLVMHKPEEVAKKEIAKMIEEEIERFQSGKFTIDEVILSSGVRDLSEYKMKDGKLPNLPQIRAMLQLQEAGIIVPPGSKVEYIPFKVPSEYIIKYVKGELKLSHLRQLIPRKKKDVKPLYERVVARELVEDKFEELKEFVDVDYYLDSQILPPVMRFAKAMWPDFKVAEKKKDTKTKSLMSFLKPRRKVGEVAL